jgi:hypothetical protein
MNWSDASTKPLSQNGFLAIGVCRTLLLDWHSGETKAPLWRLSGWTLRTVGCLDGCNQEGEPPWL